MNRPGRKVPRVTRTMCLMRLLARTEFGIGNRNLMQAIPNLLLAIEGADLRTVATQKPDH